MPDLTLAVYEKYSTTIKEDPGEDLKRASINRVVADLQGPAEMDLTIPRDVTAPMQISGSDRIVAEDGLTAVYEGMIRTRDFYVGGGADQGILLECAGFWGAMLARQVIDKRWADDRLTDDIWVLQDTDGADLCGLNRTGQFLFAPKREEWKNGDYIGLRYSMPTGQTVKRVTYDYELDEEALESPKKVWHFDSGGPSFFDKPNTYDGNPATSNTVSMTTGDFFYVDILEGTDYDFVRIDFGGTVNANTATLTAQYPTVDTAGNVTWNALTITDGTSSGGKTWAQDGDITFTRPEDLAPVSISGSRRAWVRFIVSANLTANIVINEVYVGQQQAWKISLYNVGTASEIVTVTSSASGSTDHTLATPSQSIELRFVSLAKQTPPSNGTVFGLFSSLMVYSETGNINMYEIALDCANALATAGLLNSTSHYLNNASNPLSLVPFYTNGPESWANILQRAVALGDDDQNEWRVYIRPSIDAASPNGRPVLALEQYGSASDAEYVVSLEELEAPVSVIQDFDGVVNWAVILRRDEELGDVFLTPDDDSTLKDDDSITKWGTMPPPAPLNIGGANQSVALAFGKRYLAAYKNPKFIVSGPLKVKGAVRKEGGGEVPITQIKTGVNIRIENFLEDVAEASGSGLIFRITRVSYNDRTETADIYTGLIPDVIEIWLAQQAAGLLTIYGSGPADPRRLM